MAKQEKKRFNPVNERAKYKYRIHLSRAFKKDEKTAIAALKHIRDFEIFTGFNDFKYFNDSVADKYLRHLSDRGCSLSYQDDNIRVLRNFYAG